MLTHLSVNIVLFSKQTQIHMLLYRRPTNFHAVFRQQVKEKKKLQVHIKLTGGEVCGW